MGVAFWFVTFSSLFLVFYCEKHVYYAFLLVIHVDSPIVSAAHYDNDALTRKLDKPAVSQFR